MQSYSCIENTRALWILGDWLSLSLLATDNDRDTSIEQKLYIAASLYQLGRADEAKAQFLELELTPEQKNLAANIFISGAYNSLGKAYACTNNYEHAEKLCKRSLTELSDQPISAAQLNARTSEQLAQLGIPRLADNIAAAEFKPDAETYLKASSTHFSHEPSIQVALAELYQLREHYDHAIVHWQNASSLLSTETPQHYYDRLKDAYKSVKGFPQGTVEQETLRGDIDKHRLLSEIHNHLQPEFYFEIGVQTGKSLSLAKCEAVGIDPMPMLSFELPATAKVITSSSDNFFKKQSDLLLKKSIDLCFIDGMHLFEYALRDFINVEKYAQPHSLIVIDDIFPGHPDQAKRERCTRAWTGDVWKVKTVLEKYRPDLFMLAIDAYPTGLLLITALDPTNTTLSDSYPQILQEYPLNQSVPNEAIQRPGVASGKSELIFAIIKAIKNAKKQRQSAAAIKNILTSIEPIR